MISAAADFHQEVSRRLDTLAERAADGTLDPAVDLLVEALDAGGVIQAFGTGHSEAFAMEIAGRAGGLIPTTRIALRDVVLYGDRPVTDLEGATMERDPDVVEELLSAAPLHEHDVFVIASNSGVNGSIVGLALAAKERGHKIIAVTSMEHTMAVQPKHPSGKRLIDVADVVIDNLAPFGDATLTLGEQYGAGAVSSMTAAFIAQALTLGVTERMLAAGAVPPLYISANRPGGDDHNHALEDRYRGRIRRGG
ncbi:sugar isomerase domain-containing protein [Ruania halotolerans]|uniref:sugar isomerase domain-containing protein n=1 Tax=Ruania halotolerans TaxID=2897773 RepID=UPI001E5D2B84|nr:SIS domain-containing protein [Ruania halotolerans]UFU08121.1 SIS domain-containing protein [Ruania halotolerans]